jgi:hypothetical protein
VVVVEESRGGSVMTVPPGGPYGQGPYGSNPYGQDPYSGGQPQGGAYPYPQGGAYPYPQGGPYPHPQAGPYANPYAAQYPQAGQQVPPGGPPGYYPPGPPNKGSGSKLPWLIVAGLVALSVIALVATLMVLRGGGHNKPSSAQPSVTSAPATQPNGSAQTASDCSPNVSGGEPPKGDTIAAGKLSFPASAAPGWAAYSDDQQPNLIGAVGVGQDVPGSNQWMMTAEVAVTNFIPSMDLKAQASKLMQCIVNGSGYANTSPTLGAIKTSSITVDGTNAARADADVTIADPSRNVKGDSVSIIAVDTKPVTVFMGTTPIGDAGSAAIISSIIAALKVSKS